MKRMFYTISGPALHSWPSIVLLAQLVAHYIGIAEVIGSTPSDTSPISLFKLSFRYGFSGVHTCDDGPHINLTNSQFNISWDLHTPIFMRFIITGL